MSNNDVYKRFGERLKSLRTERNLTQSQLAEALGMAQPTIYKYEKGIRKIPMSVLEKFASFFKMSISELVEQEIDNVKDVDGEPNYIREIKAYNLTESEIDEIMKYVRYVVTQRNH